jgi:hypothetical protein
MADISSGKEDFSNLVQKIIELISKLISEIK